MVFTTKAQAITGSAVRRSTTTTRETGSSAARSFSRRILGADDLGTLWLCQKAIENDHRNSGLYDYPIENGGSFHSYVSLPEGIPSNVVVAPRRKKWLVNDV
jgi:hypothetical protein